MRIQSFGKTLPTPGDLHVNAALTNVAIAWKQSSTRFVAGRAFPEVPVDHQSNAYHQWDVGDFFRDEAEEASPNSDVPLMNQGLSNDTYFAKKYHLGGLISEMDQQNQDPAVDKEIQATQAITNKLLIKREKIWVTNYFTAGVWTGSTTGTDITPATKWDNYGASQPVTELRNQILYLARLGIDPMDMKITMGVPVFQVLLDHPRFLERYEQVQASILNEQLMAAVLGVGEVVVPYSASNSAGPGDTANIGYLHSDNVLLSYSPRAPAIDSPSAGYTFQWRKLIGAGADGIRIRRYWDNAKSGWVVVGDMAFDLKKTSSICGVLFTDVLST